ncbi:MAG: GNAT family N-acetyltransferase [Zetaproteobacteria bacterium]|nr:GNAT family N-acetyltransferase [Zetaproteobacteria bacterium]
MFEDLNFLPPSLSTQRWLLRPFSFVDIPDLVGIFSGGGMQDAGFPPLCSEKFVVSWVLKGQQEPSLKAYAITCNHSSRLLLGGVSLSRQQDGVGLGFWVRESCRRHGVAFEAVREVCLQLKALAPGLQVQASCLPHNFRSRRCLLKLGFMRISTSLGQDRFVWAESLV